MLFRAYSTLFSCFGKWDLMCQYHQHEMDREVPHGWDKPHGPVSLKNLAYILPRAWQYHGKIVLPMSYCCCVYFLWFDR